MRGRILTFLQNGLRRNVLLSAAQTGVEIVVVFLVYRYIINVFGPEYLGLWSLTIGLAAFVRAADVSGGAGLSHLVATSKFKADKEISNATLIDTATLLAFSITSVICLLAFPMLNQMVHFIAPVPLVELGGNLLLMAALIVVISSVSNASLSALDGFHRADLRSLIAIGGTIVFVSTSLLFLQRCGIYSIAIARILEALFNFVIARIALQKFDQALILIPCRLTRPAVSECFGYGMKLQGLALAVLLVHPLSRVALGSLAGLSTLGVYELAQRIAQATRTLLAQAAAPLIPALSAIPESRPEELVGLVKSILDRMVPIAAGICSILIIGLPIASLFFFANFNTTFMILAAALLLAASLGNTALVYFILGKARNRMKWNYVGQWLIVAVSIPSIYGISRFAPELAGLGVAFALALGNSVMIAQNARAFNVPLPSKFQLTISLTVIGIAGLAAIAVANLDLSIWFAFGAETDLSGSTTDL